LLEFDYFTSAGLVAKRGQSKFLSQERGQKMYSDAVFGIQYLRGVNVIIGINVTVTKNTAIPDNTVISDGATVPPLP